MPFFNNFIFPNSLLSKIRPYFCSKKYLAGSIFWAEIYNCVHQKWGHTNSDYSGVDIGDDDTRIVNGYDSAKRPWLALMLINGGSCGGSLINHKYLL